MIPNLDDATDMLAVLRYNLGLFKKEPLFGKFNYGEKMEMAQYKIVEPQHVHWYEVLLAIFAMLIWHFYLVIFSIRPCIRWTRRGSMAKFLRTMTGIHAPPEPAHGDDSRLR